MELAAGQSWHEHHSVHPIFVQVAQGRGDFPREGPRYYPGARQADSRDRQAVAPPARREGLHLLVTMLTGESHPEPKVNIDVEEVNPRPLNP